MKKIGLVLLAMVMVNGCARTVWVHPEYTPEKWRKDSYECERDARQSGYFGGGITGSINMQNFFNRCLESKGWSRQREASTINVPSKESPEEYRRKMADEEQTDRERWQSMTIDQRRNEVKKSMPNDRVDEEALKNSESFSHYWVLRRTETTRPEKPITSAPITPSLGTTRIVTWDFSVVKSAPGDNYSSIATVRKGYQLTILEQSGEWVRVRLQNGQEGWIRSEVFE